MASDEADDKNDKTVGVLPSQQRRLSALLFLLSATVTITLLIFFYHIRILIKPRRGFFTIDAEQKDDELGHGLEIWELLLSACVPVFTWRYRRQLCRLLQRCCLIQQRRSKAASFLIISVAALSVTIILQRIFFRPTFCSNNVGSSWMTTDVGYIRTHPHTRSSGVSMRTLCDGRVWEPWVAHAVEQHLYHQGRAIDVGAFVGYHTIRLAKAAAPYDVYAFEGRPPSDLNDNIKRNNAMNVHLVKETIDENWKLSPQLEKELLNNNNDDGDEGPPVALVKIDCEGCELHFLKGAKKVLQKYHPVLIIEIQDDYSRRNTKVGGQRMIQPNEESREDVLRYLRNELGYIVEALKDDDGVETWDYLAYALT